MKKFNIKTCLVLSLAGLLVSCGKASTFVVGDEFHNVQYGLAGRTAKTNYKALIGTAQGNLNHLATSEAADAFHFANFLDGLLLQNEYGVLEKNIATEVTTNEDYSEFTFTVPTKKIPWVRNNGKQYQAVVNGKKTAQWISPEDWVTSAKTVSTYQRQSSLQYLIGMFIEGAQEYYHYTQIQYEAALEKQKNPNREGPWQKALKDKKKCADKLNELIKESSPTVWKQQYKNGDNAITPNQVDDIKSGARFGVRANGDKVTYKLILSASYFPTLFTYSCFLPTNEHFLKEIGWTDFGKSKENILYCGPYLLKSADEKKIKYVSNPTYWNKDNVIVIDEINYTILSEAEAWTTREEFESGRIDGFAINSLDEAGWEDYIVGPDNEGTMENPYDPRVNSRLLDTIGSMYGSNIHINRVKNGRAQTSYWSGSSAETLANTERALSITEVRKALLDAIPYQEFFKRYGATEVLQTQEMVHTYVPKGFVTNDLGNDYVEDNYLEVYAEKKGIEKGSFSDPFDPATPVNERTAAWYHHPGQYASRILTQTEMNERLDTARHAIDLYNQINDIDITLPIDIEYYTVWSDDKTKSYDAPVIELLNKNLNYGSTEKTLFNVVPTDEINTDNAQTASSAGSFDFSIVLWGWGADYGDPLTFMNTYRKGNGDWASIFPFVGEGSGSDEEGNPLPGAMSWKIDEVTGDLVEFELLGEYTELVDAGADETNDLNARFTKFAEAEYLLLEELAFYRPQVNQGQGWSVSVSCAASYYGPQGSFGLANDRLTGMYVFTREDMLLGDERQFARAEFEKNKAAYIEAINDQIEADKEAGRENRNTAAINIY